MKVKIRVAAKLLFVALGLLAASQAGAVVTRPPHTIRGARSDNASKKLGAPSLTGDSTVVGTVNYDSDGNVVVKWGPNRFVVSFDSIAPKDYSGEQEFLKEYIGKCESRSDKSKDSKALGAASSRKGEFTRAGKKIWTAHLEAVKAAQAAAANAKAEDNMVRQKLLAGLPLESLFGIKLGKPIDQSSYEKTSNGKAHVFAPAKKFKSFDRYTFRVSPTSKVVYQIQAVSPIAAAADAEDEWSFVRKALMKKFQKQDVQEDSDGEGYSLLFPGADGKVGRMVVVRRTETGMSITAVDIGLKKKAEEEQLAIDSDDAL